MTTEYRQFRFQRPPGSTELVLVRHGESAPARFDRPYPFQDGHGDPELAPQGREQADRLAERFKDEHFDAIYVTILRRTAETAAPLAERLGIVPQVEPDLREVHLGEWEGGLLRKHVAEGHPLAVKLYAEQRWDVIPGAESNEQLAERTSTGIRRIAEKHPDQRVLVVAHGGAIGQVLATATGAEPFTFSGSDNASVSVLVVAGERWILRGFNDVSHLR
ncbi:histidine phosphatase family protein [Kutzneria sp. CA-103260]|uniref:histidine phosphatase family protein n=1 Tax=Kutzneria sp. CA-103260 TaxID=2802641 RepID=UPI001BA9234B|nr:histidine phosphatase family protein [Kutzneria sp. CA-103260]QUQ72238.1 phosphoglycerate mutase [Kutzneria sp. CA-103260]